jgi:hypothetical protein
MDKNFDPYAELERAQLIINTLRSHLHAATDALVKQEVDNAILRALLKKESESVPTESTQTD